MKRILVGAACVAVLALSACSSSSDATSGGASPAAKAAPKVAPSDDATSWDDATADLPKCSDVWVEGGKLAADYTGCMDGDSVRLASTFTCKDGTQLASDDEDTAWATIPGTVHVVKGQIAADKAYAKAYANCNS